MNKHKNKKSNWRDNLTGWLLSAPYLIYALIFFLIPLGAAIWLSTMDWNLMSPDREFVALDNFINLFKDENVRAAALNSYKYLIPIVILSLIFGLIIALLVHELPKKIKGVVAVLFVIPYLTSGVATSVVMKYLLSYNSIFNVFLRDKLGLDIKWLQNPKSAFWIMIMIIIWKMGGYYALFILSGIESISQDVIDAAKIDGSTGLHKLFNITLPIITPTLTTVIVMATGLSFGIFTEPFLLTGGGPNKTTTTWMIEIYYRSFTSFDSGYGAAMAIMSAIQIFITIRLISYLMNKLSKKFGY